MGKYSSEKEGSSHLINSPYDFPDLRDDTLASPRLHHDMVTKVIDGRDVCRPTGALPSTRDPNPLHRHDSRSLSPPGTPRASHTTLLPRAIPPPHFSSPPRGPDDERQGRLRTRDGRLPASGDERIPLHRAGSSADYNGTGPDDDGRREGAKARRVRSRHLGPDSMSDLRLSASGKADGDLGQA